jgi:hypothetical protein
LAASRRIAVFCCFVSSNLKFCLPTPCSLLSACHITSPLWSTSRLCQCAFCLLPPAAYRPDIAIKASTIRAFDDSITRMSFGWPDGARQLLVLTYVGFAAVSSFLSSGLSCVCLCLWDKYELRSGQACRGCYAQTQSQCGLQDVVSL